MRRPVARLSGIAVAGITALISGVSVFVNSYGVHAITPPSVYTTAKNLVATLCLAVFTALGLSARRALRNRQASGASLPWGSTMLAGFIDAPDRSQERPPTAVVQLAALAYVGVVGGGLAFVLFFNGLAETTATAAQFWRDSLLIWVALLAPLALRERIRWWNVVAIGLLVGGQIWVAGGIGHLAANRGEMLVLASSLLWAIEILLAKHLLRGLPAATVSLVRMGVGAVTLVIYLAATSHLDTLVVLDGRQVVWALSTGALLACYVATWLTALARARAIDVSSVLVASALVTWLLQVIAGTAPMAPSTVGLGLVAGGTVLVIWAAFRRDGNRRRPGVSTVP